MKARRRLGEAAARADGNQVMLGLDHIARTEIT